MLNEKKQSDNIKSQEKLDPASQSLLEALNLSFKILKGIIFLLIFLFLFSGVFTVEQNEVAMVLRFGKIKGLPSNRILKPGLHWTLPYPFSEIIKIPTGEEHTLKIDNFWYHDVNKNKFRKKIPKMLDPEYDGYCLTGDVNIIHYKWQIRYLIKKPYEYYLNIKNNEQLLKKVICNCIVKVTSTFKIHDALRGNIDILRAKVKQLAQRQLENLNSGIELKSLAVPNVEPPRQVQDAFKNVILAKNKKDRKIEIAENYKQQVINKALGKESEIITQAKNYALQVEKEAQSDSNYFKNLVKLYSQNPRITKQQLYQQVMEQTTDKIRELFLFANKVKNRELRIKLNRNPELHRVKAAKED